MPSPFAAAARRSRSCCTPDSFLELAATFDRPLVDDSTIETSPRTPRLLNASSPGATAWLGIGDTFADWAAETFRED